MLSGRALYVPVDITRADTGRLLLPGGRGSASRCKQGGAVLSRARKQAVAGLFQQPASVGSARRSVHATVRVRAALLIGAAVSLIACRQDMHDQPRYRALEPSEFFADGRSARPIPAGAVARGHLNETGPQYTGTGPNGQFVDTMPVALSRQLVLRGQQRYDIYCSPCHGLNADGQGMVALRGFLAPPSLHTDRARRMPVGYIFAVITDGFGGMPSYSDQIPVADRWAIISYLRALQISHEATVADVPADRRGELDGAQ